MSETEQKPRSSNASCSGELRGTTTHYRRKTYGGSVLAGDQQSSICGTNVVNKPNLCESHKTSSHELNQNTTTISTATAHQKSYSRTFELGHRMDKCSRAKSVNPLLPDDEQEPEFIALYNWFFIAPEQKERIVPIKQLLSETLKAWALSSTVLYVSSLAWIVGETKFSLYSSRLLPIPIVLIFYTARNLVPHVQDDEVRDILWYVLAALAWIFGLTYLLVITLAVIIGIYGIGMCAAVSIF